MRSIMSMPFFIPDTSPLLSYSPCVDCQPGSGGSWKAGYRPRGDGYDQTFHEAGRSGTGGLAPTIQVNLTASSVSIWTAGSGEGCPMRYKIDEGEFVDGCSIASYPSGRHTLTITPQDGKTGVQILGISGESIITATGWIQNRTLDTTDSSFAFTGDWSHLSSIGTTGSGGNATLVDEFLNTGMSGFYNSTAAVSTVKGGEMVLRFEGTAIYLYGMAGPSGGAATVMLDNVLMNTLNTTSAWRAYSSLLFFATDLAAGSHEVKLSNLVDGRQLVVDYAQVTIPGIATSGPNLPFILGLVSGLSGVLLVTSVILYICITKHRAPKKPKPIYAFSKGLSYGDLSPAQASSIDTWRRKTAGSSGSSTPSTASHSGPYSGLAAHLQPGRPDAVPAGTPAKSPPPTYPDYLPYRGPIEQHLSSRPESVEVPGVVGMNASASGWLSQTRNDMLSIPTGQEGGGNVHRPGPIPLRERQDHSGMYEISLDNPCTQQGLISPASTLSSLEFTGKTVQAMGATRSVARLWPTSVFMTTSPPSTSPIPGGFAPTSAPALGLDLNERSLGGQPVVYPPLPGTAPSAARTPQSADAISNQAIDAGTYSTDTYYRSSSGHPPPAALRRGVSIKSAKTMRSFFSGLLVSGASPPYPEAPAMPALYSDAFVIGTPARPDSDIFPAASVSRNNSLVRAPSSRGLVISSRQSQAREVRELKDVPEETSRTRVTMGSYTSSVPPMLRLDTGGENFFIELSPESPVTRVGKSRSPSGEVETGRMYA